jgi:hypothetical protein
MHIALTDVASVHIGKNSEHVSYTWWFRGREDETETLLVYSLSSRDHGDVCICSCDHLCVFPPISTFEPVQRYSDETW